MWLALTASVQQRYRRCIPHAGLVVVAGSCEGGAGSPGHGAHVACADCVSAAVRQALRTREMLMQRHYRCIPHAGLVVVAGSCEGDAVSPGHGAHVACTDWVSAAATQSLRTRERLLHRCRRCIPHAVSVAVAGSCEGYAGSPGHGAHVAGTDWVSAAATQSLRTRERRLHRRSCCIPPVVPLRCCGGSW